VLAAADRVGVDAEQAEQAGDGALDPLPEASASSISACGGASNERSTDTGMPAELPGV
jgi:hypothetical protein